jgi:hypothetical protein
MSIRWAPDSMHPSFPAETPSEHRIRTSIFYPRVFTRPRPSHRWIFQVLFSLSSTTQRRACDCSPRGRRFTISSQRTSSWPGSTKFTVSWCALSSIRALGTYRRGSDDYKSRAHQSYPRSASLHHSQGADKGQRPCSTLRLASLASRYPPGVEPHNVFDFRTSNLLP